MIPRVIQELLLSALYDAFAGWAGTFAFACRKGCATCCTRSLTMTSLEGEAAREKRGPKIAKTHRCNNLDHIKKSLRPPY